MIFDKALQEVEKVVIDGIKATQQKFVKDIKAKAADKKLTPEECMQALEMTKEYFYSHITQDSLNVLQTVVGDVDKWLQDFIEAKLYDVKKEDK